MRAAKVFQSLPRRTRLSISSAERHRPASRSCRGTGIAASQRLCDLLPNLLPLARRTNVKQHRKKAIRMS